MLPPAWRRDGSAPGASPAELPPDLLVGTSLDPAGFDIAGPSDNLSVPLRLYDVGIIRRLDFQALDELVDQQAPLVQGQSKSSIEDIGKRRHAPNLGPMADRHDSPSLRSQLIVFISAARSSGAIRADAAVMEPCEHAA